MFLLWFSIIFANTLQTYVLVLAEVQHKLNSTGNRIPLQKQTNKQTAYLFCRPLVTFVVFHQCFSQAERTLPNTEPFKEIGKDSLVQAIFRIETLALDNNNCKQWSICELQPNSANILFALFQVQDKHGSCRYIYRQID